MSARAPGCPVDPRHRVERPAGNGSGRGPNPLLQWFKPRSPETGEMHRPPSSRGMRFGDQSGLGFRRVTKMICSNDIVASGGLDRRMHEKGKGSFRAFQPEIPRSQIADFKEEFGRGEWIRTTDLLVPKNGRGRSQSCHRQELPGDLEGQRDIQACIGTDGSGQTVEVRPAITVNAQTGQTVSSCNTFAIHTTRGLGRVPPPAR